MNKQLKQEKCINTKYNDEKSANGITILALSITIIILLTLAGISIATLTGENRTNKSICKCKRTNRN